MRFRCSAAFGWLVALLAAAPVAAQQAPLRARLDSGAVVRLHWSDGREKARLMAPFGPESLIVRYCRYPSPVCGRSTHNPELSRSRADLIGMDVRRGSRVGRGALVGAGVGTALGLLYLLGQGLSDAPALSTREQVLSVTVIGGVWSGLGALVGSASDNWRALR